MQMPSAQVFYDTCSCLLGRPRQTSHGGLANQDGKQGLGGQVGSFSCRRRPSSPLLLCPHHLAATIGAPVLHFNSSIPLPLRLSPSETRTPNPAPASTEASASSCQPFALQAWIVMGVMCQPGQKKKPPYSHTALKLQREIAYIRCRRRQ